MQPPYSERPPMKTWSIIVAGYTLPIAIEKIIETPEGITLSFSDITRFDFDINKIIKEIYEK